MFKNTLFFKNINNYNFNFKKILKSSNTLLIINCNNITLTFKSKINKIILQNCNNIKIKVGNMISGISIENSKEVDVMIYKNKKINCLELFNSNIKINKLNYQLINENSFIKL
tara:strand:- start:1143 stop:1481 length:339 start_codon:yes stop_codon:yes gene_type:complete